MGYWGLPEEKEETVQESVPFTACGQLEPSHPVGGKSVTTDPMEGVAPSGMYPLCPFLAGGECTLTRSLKKTRTRTHIKKTVNPLNIFVIYIFKNEKTIMFVC